MVRPIMPALGEMVVAHGRICDTTGSGPIAGVAHLALYLSES